MKRLILMRHAKSDWSGGATSDHDRALNKRGRTSAAKLGNWMRETDLTPDQILSSSAVRTQETLARLELPDDIDVSFTRDLYLAPPDRILAALQNAAGAVVLMIGHNPGIAMMAEHVLSQQPDLAGFERYPTGATLVADFQIDEWKKANWGNAQMAHFVMPRDL